MSMHPHGVEHPRIYSREYYQRIRDLEERHWWYIGMRAIAAVLLPPPSTRGQRRRVLDAGCGTGAALTWARHALGASEVTGIDISWYALEFCRQRGEGRLSQASVMELPFRDGCFDVVVCNDVLQHLPTAGGDVEALREAWRVLSRGGLLLVRTNSRLGRSRDGDIDPDFQQYRLEEVLARMESAGFVRNRGSYVNALPALYAVVRERLRRRRHSSSPSHDHQLYQGLGVRETILKRPWLNRLLTWILMAEAAYLSRPGRRLPFGHTIVCLGIKPHDR